MRNVSSNLLLVLTSAIACLFGLECALRVAIGPPIIWRFPQESYVLDDEMGYALRPIQQAFTMDKPLEINSYGIRETEVSTTKTDRSLRILALGDSQTFGVGLLAEETWPKQLQLVLSRELSGCRIEVVNAGLPASATWNQEILARRLSRAYRPDVIVVGFYVNDVMKATGQAPFSPQRRSALALRAIYLAKRSAVVTALWQAWSSLRQLVEPSADSLHERFIVEDSHPSETAPGWSQVRASLEQMRDDARSAGTGLVVMAMPRADEIDGRTPGGRWQARLSEITGRLGVTLVDTLPGLQEAAALAELITIRWDGHFNATAQAAMAKVTANAILDEMQELVRDRCTSHAR